MTTVKAFIAIGYLFVAIGLYYIGPGRWMAPVGVVILFCGYCFKSMADD